MSAEQPRVSIVVVSYNRPHFLEAALQSTTRQSYGQAEIIVVDNRSGTSDQIAGIVAKFPGVQLISNSTNRGFGAAVNIGVARASGDFVCITEDDQVLHEDAIQAFVDFWNAEEGVGLAGGLIYNKTSGTIRSAGGRLSLGARYMKHLFAWDEPDRGQFHSPFPVTFLPGSFLFTRRDLLMQLGGFREDFFMYYEDEELCLRIAKLGYRILLVPAAKVDHFEPDATPMTGTVLWHIHKNFLVLNFLHAPAAELPMFFARYGLWRWVRAAPQWDDFRMKGSVLMSTLRDSGSILAQRLRLQRQAPSE